MGVIPPTSGSSGNLVIIDPTTGLPIPISTTLPDTLQQSSIVSQDIPTLAIALLAPETNLLMGDFIKSLETAKTDADYQQYVNGQADNVLNNIISGAFLSLIQSLQAEAAKLATVSEQSTAINATQTAQATNLTNNTPVLSQIRNSSYNTQVSNIRNARIAIMNAYAKYINDPNADNALQDYSNALAVYNTAVNTWNSYISTKNPSVANAFASYNNAIDAYNQGIDAANAQINTLNETLLLVGTNPPPTLYPLETPLPHLDPSSFVLSSAQSVPPGTPTSLVDPHFFPNSLTTSTITPITVITPEKEGDLETQYHTIFINILTAYIQQLNNVQLNSSALAALKAFGLKFTIPPTQGQTGNDLSSTQNASVASGLNNVGSAQNRLNLEQGFTQSQLDQLTLQYGVPAGSPLVAELSLLISQIFQNASLFGSQQAAITLQTDPTAGVLNGAGAGVVAATSLISLLNNAFETGNFSNIISTNIQNLPGLESLNLSDEDKQNLTAFLTTLVTSNVIAVAVAALSSQLGTPGLLPQFLANVLGLTPDQAKQQLNNDLFLSNLAQNPVAQVFLQTLLTSSLTSSLNISEDQASSIANDVITKTVANINDQSSATQVADIATGQLNSDLLAAGIQTDTTNVDNLLSSLLTASINSDAIATAQNQSDDLATSNLKSDQLTQDILSQNLNSSLIQAGFTADQALAAQQTAINALQDDLQRDATIANTIQTDNIKSALKDELIKEDYTESSANALIANLPNNLGTLSGTDLQNGLIAALEKSGLGADRATTISAAVTQVAATSAPALNPLITPNITTGISPIEDLGNQVAQKIVQDLSGTLGVQQATIIANDAKFTLFDSANSLYAISSSQVHDAKNTTQEKQVEAAIAAAHDFLDGTVGTDTYVSNFLDPAKSLILSYQKAPPKIEETEGNSIQV